MRVVIDTNIWVSGLLWKGEPWRLLQRAEQGDIQICLAYPMLLELQEVLAYQRLQSRLKTLQQTPEQLVAYALSLSTVFDVRYIGPPIVTADPDDDIFVLCALEANAQYLISGDRHLLDVGTYRDVKIVTVTDFVRLELDID